MNRNGTGSPSPLPVVAVGGAVALSLFGDMAMYVILPVHFSELGLTAIQVGILLSANRWIRLFTNGIARRMLTKWSSRMLFPATLLAGSAIAAAYSAANHPAVPTFVMLLILRIAWGVCWSFIRHTGVMKTIGTARQAQAARRMGIYLGLVQAGFVAGTFVAGMLYDSVGYTRAFLLAAVFSLAAVPVAVVAERKSNVDLRSDRTAARPGTDLQSVLLSVRGFIVSLVGAGLIMSTLGFLLRERYGETVPVGSVVVGVATVNGFLLAFQYLVNSVGSPALGAAIDRFGLMRSQTVGFIAAGATLLMMGVFGTTWVFFVLVVLFFVTGAVSRLAVESQAARAGPRAYSGLATATDLGSAVGPVVGWVGIGVAQSTLVFWVGGGLFAAAALASVVQMRNSTETGS